MAQGVPILALLIPVSCSSPCLVPKCCLSPAGFVLALLQLQVLVLHTPDTHTGLGKFGTALVLSCSQGRARLK